jgi:predicted kinase
MAKTRKVLINIGLPGSGKTTWSKDFVSKNPDWVRVGRDDFRFMLKDSPILDPKGEKMLNDLMTQTTRKALLSGYNVVLDNTHCKLKYINEAVASVNDLADVDFRYFDVPMTTCIERDKLREKKVGTPVITKMAKDLAVLLDTFGWQPVKQKGKTITDYTANWDPALPFAVITDVDGTIAHMGTRRGPFDWKKVGVDAPDPIIIGALKAWKMAGFNAETDNIQILVVSGRDGSCRKETEEWLDAYGVPHDAIFMRPANDFRKDSLIKKEIYENDIKGKYNVIMVYDDRNQVVDVWRGLGLKCAQVEPGEF